MIIQISGKMGSGKTALVNKLKTYLTVKGCCVYYKKYADPLYEMHDAVLNILKNYGIERGPKDRDLLQVLGTEYGRNCIGENVWADMMKNCTDKFFNDDSFLSEKRIVLIDDCRFPNELSKFPDAFTVRLVCFEHIRKARAESWSDKPHASESALEGHEDAFTLAIDTGVNDIEKTFQEVINHERLLRFIGP